MKLCIKCGESKELKYFSKDKKRQDGVYVYCKSCVKEISHERYLKNKDEINQKTKEWKRSNREYYLSQQKEYQKERIKTPNYKYREYKIGALERDLVFEISKDEFMTFWQKSCSYCGAEIETIGLDRVDNSKGYELSNLKTCCFKCN